MTVTSRLKSVARSFIQAFLWVTRAEVLAPSSDAFPRLFAGSCIRHRQAGTQDHMECWRHSCGFINYTATLVPRLYNLFCCWIMLKLHAFTFVSAVLKYNSTPLFSVNFTVGSSSFFPLFSFLSVSLFILLSSFLSFPIVSLLLPVSHFLLFPSTLLPSPPLDSLFLLCPPVHSFHLVFSLLSFPFSQFLSSSYHGDYLLVYLN